MTNDLENTLAELAPEYRTLVARLENASEVEPRRQTRIVLGPRFRPIPIAAAAALVVALLGFSILFGPSRTAADVATDHGPREYVLSVQSGLDAALEIVRTQKPDGSWQNDYLTRRYAAALKTCPDARAQLAYRKALRNLRVRGLL